MTRIKICGLRRLADIHAANVLRPDYIGFVFAPGRRRVTARAAADLRAALDAGIQAVGVFVNPALDEVAALCRDGVVDLVQLHGDEDEAFISRVRDTTGVPVIKSVPVGAELPALPQSADCLLFDAVSAARGGSGRAFDWTILEGYRGAPYFLAGGLHPGNVARAIQTLSPYAVDVSSGVESGGWKDPVRMAAFVERVRGCAALQTSKGADA